MAEKKASSKFPGRIVKVKDFVQEESKIEWLIEDILPSVGWTLLVGMKGIGKTTFALQICYALQTGEDFLGKKVKRSRTLIIQCDSSEAEWREFLRIRFGDSFIDTGVAFPTNCLDNDEYMHYTGGLIALANPEFIVFDSLYKFSSVPINTDRVLETVGKFNLLCGEIPFMVLHHPPHETTRAAGHHSLSATCSNEWFMHKNKLEILKGRLVKEKEILMRRAQDDTGGLWSLVETEYSKGKSSNKVNSTADNNVSMHSSWLDKELIR